MIIDTHAHYDDEAFDTDREALLTSMYDGGIEKIVNVCASVGGFQDTVKLMEKYPFVYGAVGIHPDDADKMKRQNYICIMTMTEVQVSILLITLRRKDRKSTRLNSSHWKQSRMPSSA